MQESTGFLNSVLNFLRGDQQLPQQQNIPTLGGEPQRGFPMPMTEGQPLGQHNLLPQIGEWINDQVADFQPGAGVFRGTRGLNLSNRLTQEQIQEIIRLRNEAGQTFRRIGDQFNMSSTSVMNLLRRQDQHVPTPERVGVQRRPLFPFLDDIAARRANGETYTDIANSYNSSPNGIRNFLRRHNRDTVREPQFTNPEPVRNPAAHRIPDDTHVLMGAIRRMRENKLSNDQIATNLNRSFGTNFTADDIVTGNWSLYYRDR